MSEERPQSFHSGSHDHVSKKLMQSLCAQIDLDFKFRNLKKWFNKHEGNTCRKWREVSQALSKKGLHTTEQQNREIFELPEEEDNPFLTIRDL